MNARAPQDSLHRLRLGLGWIVVLLGSMVLVGWTLDIATLKGVRPGLATMKANTALCLLLGGVALLLWTRTPGWRRRVMLVASGTVTIIAAATLAEHGLAIDLGIDELLVADRPLSPVTLAPGRMGVNSAWALLAIGAGLLVADRSPHLSQMLALAATLLAYTVFIGYFESFARLAGSLTSYSSMALHTMGGLLLLAGGVLLLRPDTGVARLVHAEGLAGSVVRILPTGILVLPLLNLTVAAGHRLGLYGPEWQAPLTTVLSAVLIVALVVWSAQALIRVEAERAGAADQLREREASLRLALDGSGAGSWSWDAVTGASTWDAAFQRQYGFVDDEPRAFDTWIGRIHPDDRDRVLARFGQTRTVAGDESWEEEFRVIVPGRGVRWMLGLARAHRTADGALLRVAGLNVDITDRKHAAEAQRQIETRLRTGERRFQTLMDATHTVTWACPPTGLHVEPQPAWMAFTGQTADEMLGAGWLTAVHPDDAAAAFERWNRAAATGAPFASEHRIRRHDGVFRWMTVAAAPVRDEEGRIVEWFGMNTDITDRKQREEQLAFSAALETALSGGRSEDELLRIAGARIAAHFGLDHCLFVAIDVQAGTATVRHDHHAPDCRSLVGTYRLTDFHSADERDALGAGHPLVINDVHTDREAARAAAFDALSIGALLNAPVVVDGHWSFVLSAMRTTPCQWRDDERDLLLDLARRVALRLERARSREAVRASAQQLRFVTDHVPVLLVQCDAEARYTFVNAAYAARFGVQPSEAIGRRIVDVVGAAAYASFGRYVEAALRGERVEFEEEVPYDYGTRWMHGHYVPDIDESGRTRGFVAVIQDVTEVRRSHLAAAQLAAIVTSSSDAILSMNLDGTITTWNAAAERLFGYTAAQIIGQSVRTLLPANRQDEEDRILARLRAGETIAGYETVRVTKAGWLRDVALTVSPIADANGRVVGASKAIRDITKRKAAERALHTSEARFRGMFENAAVGIGLYDVDSRILRVNQTLCEMTGYSSDELLTRTAIDITYPEDVAAEAALARELVSGARDRYTLDKRYVRKDGTALWVTLSVSRAPAVGGEPPTFVGIAQDISARKAAEATLREADRQKDEFLATLAHELRNPLAPVRTSVALLKTRHLEDPVFERSRNIIERQVAQMARLLDDLLDVSRLSRGKLTLQPARVPLKDVLAAAIETSLPLLEKKNQKLVVERIDDDIVLDADAARLTQVLGNLLNNASKFSPPHTPIAVTAAFDQGTASVTVRDRGVGINAELLPSVFDLFTQADTASEMAQGGLGIGLALAKRLVELHGGTVVASSDGPGRGSTFTVRLPAERAGDAAAAAPASPSIEHLQLRRRVLVVDDNADAADTLALLLTEVGCDVRTVYGGEAAVREAQAFRPEIVFLDLGMPDVDGREVCRRIRAHAWGSDMVLIALTGWGRESDRHETRLAGFDGHLVKPADPEVVVRRVRELPERHVG